MKQSILFMVYLSLLAPPDVHAVKGLEEALRKRAQKNQESEKKDDERNEEMNRKITQERENCPTFINYPRPRPPRQQCDLGLCWAFQVSFLLSEQLCKFEKERNLPCDQHLSILDGIRRATGKDDQGKNVWRPLAENQGGLGEKEILPFIRKKDRLGICPEEYAPYFGLENSCRYIHGRLQCYKRDYRDIQKLCPSSLPAQSSLPLSDGKLEELTSVILNFQGKDPASSQWPRKFEKTKRDLIKKIQEGSSYDDALYNLLISHSCRKNRITIKEDLELEILKLGDFHEETSPSRNMNDYPTRKEFIHNFLKAGLSQGRSVGIGICADDAQTPLQARFLAGNKECNETTKGQHALVITGMEWKKGLCHVQVENFWGNGNFQGELPIHQIYPYINDLFFLHSENN